MRLKETLRGSIWTTLMLVVVAGAPLRGQGYETKFKAVGFKRGDVYHSDENLHVSLTGGALELSLPLGPALPGPIPVRPVAEYHGKYSQSLNRNWYYGIYWNYPQNSPPPTKPYDSAMEAYFKRWSPPSMPFTEIHPGVLSTDGNDGLSASLKIRSPLGGNEEYWGQGGAQQYNAVLGNLGEISTLVSTLLTTTEAQDLGSVDAGIRLASGNVLAFSANKTEVYSAWDQDPTLATKVKVANTILEIQKDYIILWAKSRNAYGADWDRKDTSGPHARYLLNRCVYHPQWIKHRSGFKLNYEIYRGTPMGHGGFLAERGILTGWKVSLADDPSIYYRVGSTDGSTGGPSVTYAPSLGVPDTTGLGFDGHTPARPPDIYFNWQPNTTSGWESLGTEVFYDDVQMTSDNLSWYGGSITHGSLTTTLAWDGPYYLLSKFVAPNGKTYLFDYATVQGVGVTQPSSPSGTPSWDFNAASPGAQGFCSLVTRMEVQDGEASQSRVTTYQWAMPVVDSAASTASKLVWAKRNQGVAQTLPTGETILHVFAAPNDLANPSSPAMEDQAKLFLAVRQAATARYQSLPGHTTWHSFSSRAAPSPSW